MNVVSLSRNIKYYRTLFKFSQAKLASLLYVSQQAVYSWEHGLTIPDVDKLYDLAKIFGVSIDNLMYDDCDVFKIIDVDYSNLYNRRLLYYNSEYDRTGDIVFKYAADYIRSCLDKGDLIFTAYMTELEYVRFSNYQRAHKFWDLAECMLGCDNTFKCLILDRPKFAGLIMSFNK